VLAYTPLVLCPDQKKNSKKIILIELEVRLVKEIVLSDHKLKGTSFQHLH
jgi:hypothetical protein